MPRPKKRKRKPKQKSKLMRVSHEFDCLVSDISERSGRPKTTVTEDIVNLVKVPVESTNSIDALIDSLRPFYRLGKKK